VDVRAVGGSPWPPVGAEARAIVRGPLIAALARAGAFGPKTEAGALDPGALFAAPLGRVREDLVRRFARQPMAAAEFDWRAELEAMRILARSGGATGVLGAQGPYEHMDGRFLLELAFSAHRAARSAAPAARQDALAAAAALCDAAAVALVGEGPSAEGAATRARAQVLDLALERGEYTRAARLADGLSQSLAAGELNERALEDVHGPEDPAHDGSPRALFGALAEQSRARVALRAGNLDTARLHAERARIRAASSAAARAHQDRLDAELSAAEQP